MADGPLVGVCSIRDPRDPALWSRTPKNICDALAAQNRLGPAVWGLPHAGLAMKLRAALTALRYGRPSQARRFLHGVSMRRAHANHILRRIADSNCKHFLHFAADRYLPLPRIPPGTHHYLIIDSTTDYWRDPEMPAAYQDLLEDGMKTAYHQMDHVFTIGRHAGQSLIERFNLPADRTSAIGSGRGIITPYAGPKNHAAPAVLFVAKERFRDKGGALLLEGFKIAAQKIPQLELWLVGDPELKRAAADLPNVKVFGFLPIPELQALFEKASLFAMPAPREPWGLVFLEALACKTPILALNKAAIPEITQNGRFGFIVNQETPAAVAEALVSACSDPANLERMGAEAQPWVVENFTWPRVAGRILERIDQPTP